tara:strand:- start:1398 stop:1508 length:111 start_codon:yes stop_codon:yes gene_type:complete
MEIDLGGHIMTFDHRTPVGAHGSRIYLYDGGRRFIT